MSGEDQQSIKPSSKQSASRQEEDDVNELLARLNSAMNIETSSNSEPEPSTSNDFSSDLLDYSLFAEDESTSARTDPRKTSSVFSSSFTLHDDDGEIDTSTLNLDFPSPTRQASTSLDVASLELDTTSRAVETSTRAMEDSARAENSVCRPQSRVSISASEREVIRRWDKKKKGKKMSKSEMEKRRVELEMWNASDSTVLEHLLQNKGSVSKWQAVATARGLCSLSNSCRCVNCQSSYVTFDNDGDGGMTEMAVGACVLQ